MTAALAKIDVGIAYAIWAALGTATVSIAGMTLFSEGCDSIKMVSLSFIVLGVVGLNFRNDH
jgi:small multidrug resistance pump